jgi:hypothetical protein
MIVPARRRRRKSHTCAIANAVAAGWRERCRPPLAPPALRPSAVGTDQQLALWIEQPDADVDPTDLAGMRHYAREIIAECDRRAE